MTFSIARDDQASSTYLEGQGPQGLFLLNWSICDFFDNECSGII